MGSDDVRVYVDLVGDLFHAGHVALLRAARRHGDQVIVGVLDDADVASYKRRPVMTLSERVAVVAACRYVDEVIEASPLRLTAQFLDEHRIDVVVHGDDLTAEAAADVYGPVAGTDRLVRVPRATALSTTALIDRVLSRARRDAE